MAYKKYTYDEEFIRFLADKGYCLDHISLITLLPKASLVGFCKENGVATVDRNIDVTPNQLKIIIERYHNGKSSREAVVGFNLSSATLISILHKQNIHVRPYADYGSFLKDLPEDLKYNISTEYIEGKTLIELEEKFGIRSRRISRYIKSLGILRDAAENNVNRYTQDFNNDAFSDFSREYDAYFYGLILSDGCLIKDKISFTLKDTDADILFKLSDYLRLGRPPRFSEVFDKRTEKTYKRVSLCFTNKVIADRLREQGLGSRKSCKEVLPSFDWRHSKHFWRGMVDGDGSLTKKGNSLVLVGSHEVVEGFLEFVKENIGLITPRKIKEIQCKTMNLSKVLLTGKDCINTVNYLYNDSTIFLDRKKKTSELFIKE